MNQSALAGSNGGTVVYVINSDGSITVTGGGETSIAGVNTGTAGVILGPCNITSGPTAGMQATWNFNGGALYTQRITGGNLSTFFNPALPATATWNFNGGVIYPEHNDATFMSGLTTANVQQGGAIFNTGWQLSNPNNSVSISVFGVNITVLQPLLNGLGGGTDGGLLKLGNGTLTLDPRNYSSVVFPVAPPGTSGLTPLPRVRTPTRVTPLSAGARCQCLTL